MPPWIEEFLPILVLLTVVSIVLVRLPKVREVSHDATFRRRRVLNWLPLGLLYAFLYWGRYNLKVSQHVFEEMTNLGGDQLMTSSSFATIFGIGTAIYGVSFIFNGPLTDRIGGRKAILIGGAGAALANVLMAVFTVMVRDRWPGCDAIGARFVTIFSVIYAMNMYFQSFGAVAIVKVNAPWFHVRERGVFGAIFGILISLGLYFAYDWSGMIVTLFGTDPERVTAPGRLHWVFLAPAIALATFWVIVFFAVKDSPGQAGLKDFDTADASSGDTGPQLGAIAVFKLMLRNPIVMTIAFIELCSGYLRQAIMQWGTTFAKHTDAALGYADSFVFAHWGAALCFAGILGGVVAGVISDHVFQSRRGPVASILYGAMLAGTIVLYFTYPTPAVAWMTIILSMFVIGVHGMLSGTASMDFGGKKNVGVAVGIIDGFVYAGTALMSLVFWLIVPDSTLTADHRIAGPTTDPANWWVWPAAMIPVALIGLVLATRVWNAKPQPKGHAAGH
jgi:OPA family glycerol-3-phosphate transporter-like MFS transporter